MPILIETNDVYQQVMDSCYQEILSSVFACHQVGPRNVIPGYWSTQARLWSLPDKMYFAAKKNMDEKSFNWALALVGASNELEEKLVNEYYKDPQANLRNWRRVINLIREGINKIEQLSSDSHLGLIRYFNPDFSPLSDALTPASLEYNLRKFGPLFAAGTFAKKEDGSFEEHTIMVTGVLYKEETYWIQFKDGLKKDVQYFSFDLFKNNLSQDKSALMYYEDKDNHTFSVRGEIQEGTLYRFKLKPSIPLESYFFKDVDEKLTDFVQLPGNQITINPCDDNSDLAPETGYVYTAITTPFSFDDLNHLSLTFFKDPQEALKNLEVNCKCITGASSKKRRIEELSDPEYPDAKRMKQ